MSTEIEDLAASAPQTPFGGLPPMVRVAFKRKRMIGIAALAFAGMILAIVLLLPNRYTATAVIMPPQQGGSAGAAMIAQLGSMGAIASAGGMGIKNPNDLQVALLKSRSVEDAMVTRFHLQTLYHRKYLSSTRKRWERAALIDSGLKDGLIRLSVTDRDPRRAAELTNGWVEEYRRFVATLAITEAAQRRLFFERQLSDARESMVRAEEEMKRTQQRTGVMELDGQTHTMIASAAMLHAQVAAKRVEIQAMRQFAADQNPDLERAEQELSSMQSQLSSMDVDNERRSGDLAAPRGKVSESGLEYARALREVKYREMVQDLLTRQYEAARVDEARQGSQVQIVDAAVVPDRPNSLNKIWIALAVALLCLPVGLLIALLTEAVEVLRICRRRSDSWVQALEEIWAGGAR